MKITQYIIEYITLYLQTAPVNLLVVAVCGLIAIKLFGWTFKKVGQAIVVYLLVMLVGQMYGFRVPTYVEVFDFLKALWFKF